MRVCYGRGCWCYWGILKNICCPQPGHLTNISWAPAVYQALSSTRVPGVRPSPSPAGACDRCETRREWGVLWPRVGVEVWVQWDEFIVDIVLLRVWEPGLGWTEHGESLLWAQREEPRTKKEGTGGSTSGQKQSLGGGGKWKEGLLWRRSLNAGW